MREIKFRGQIKDTKEWVYGTVAYSEDRKETYIVEFLEWNSKGKYAGYRFYEVIPETVGQFTGLTDKNGKEIYEGDVLLFDKNPLENFVVKFFDGAFSGVEITTINKPISEQIKMTAYYWSQFTHKVIGNIYENKELLK